MPKCLFCMQDLHSLFYKEFPGVVAGKTYYFPASAAEQNNRIRINALVWCNSVLLFHGSHR